MDELETLLRQFRPRLPSPLPDVERGRGVSPLARVVVCGIAAMVVIMVGWRVRISVSDAPRAAVTLGALTPYVVNDASDLDGILLRTSRRILPDVEQPGGALHALSKE
jgi:hypothetical protein